MNSFPCSRSDCDNKTEYGYCKSTFCIKPMNFAVGYIPEVAIPEVAPVVHARWVDDYDDSTYYCSACRGLWTLIDGTPQENNMRYCPFCGAKMDMDMNGEAHG